METHLKQLRSHSITGSFALLLLAMLKSTSVHADDTTLGQIHLRLGVYSASVSGTISGTMSFPMDADAEYELFSSYRSSLFIRANMAYEQSSAMVPYYYVGIGKRYYFGSIATAVNSTDGAQHVSSSSKLKFFAGGDLGLSVLTLKTIEFLTANSGDIEIGPHAGAIYQLTPSFGIEAYAGASFGLGFTAIAVNSTALRAFIGGTYFY